MVRNDLIPLVRQLLAAKKTVHNQVATGMHAPANTWAALLSLKRTGKVAEGSQGGKDGPLVVQVLVFSLDWDEALIASIKSRPQDGRWEM
jgi:hypothetical protein